MAMPNTLSLPTAAPAWAAGYIGLPYLSGGRTRAGLDCWGLFRLVYRDVLGIDLPAFSEAYLDAADRAETSALLSNDRSDWLAIEGDAPAQCGDGVMLRIAGANCHVGVIVARSWMLHIEDGVDASMERLDGQRWRNRIAGVYRHRLAAAS